MRVGGSDVGAICGVSSSLYPFMVYDKIMKQMDGTLDGDGDGEPDACTHGHRCEPIIADLYVAITGNTVEEPNYWQHRDPRMAILYGCSPDRKVFVHGIFEGLLEIKAPYHKMYEHVKPEHMAQMQYQMWIVGKPWCDYVAMKLDHDDPEKDKCPQILMTRVFYNQAYIETWMKPRLFYFSQCLMTRTRPPMELYRIDTMHRISPPFVQTEDLM